MTVRYEVVGALDRGVVDAMGGLGSDAILVDDGDEDLLIAQPATGGDDE
ncbi:hypothetical protein JMJ58_15085 [Haloterrigena salifodinae]|uniref:Uncharacterized protein n=1 Tax=Haloterrigena salifodinae TaxID=2675099 RepID=A0A8T8DYK2_9EURY|nr:hypothetical protein [Haloterrigena salifodinae]QRV14256.1 hypothetical protein JMJ58_15085 [Haloterrigena salifodinae]